MRAKTFGVLCTSVLFLASVAFAQDTSQRTQSDQNSNSSQNATGKHNRRSNRQSNAQSGQSETGSSNVQGNVVTGKVTKYTPGQSLTVHTNKGDRDFDLSNAQANVDPSVKVGSRVQVSETNNNGQRAIDVQPAGSQRSSSRSSNSGAAGQRRLPKTGSELPLFGLLGVMSLAAACAVRVTARKLG